MSTEQEFEVLETMMFQRPPEWGRRVIKKADGEIILQTTGDKGQTWQDAPMPEFRLYIPETETKTKSVSTNPYAGIRVRDRIMARGLAEPEELKFGDEIQAVIDSGNLLAKTTSADESGNEIETVTFIGAYAASGLSSGQVWRDDNNYLRIVP